MQGFVLLKNVQFKHINICANEINDDSKEGVSALLRRTNDEFGITIAGNPISKSVIEHLNKVAYDVHATRAPADGIDPQISIRRIAF